MRKLLFVFALLFSVTSFAEKFTPQEIKKIKEFKEEMDGASDYEILEKGVNDKHISQVESDIIKQILDEIDSQGKKFKSKQEFKDYMYKELQARKKKPEITSDISALIP